MEKMIEIRLINVYFMCLNYHTGPYLLYLRPYLLNFKVTWLGLPPWFEFEFALVRSMTSCTMRTEESLELPFEGFEKSDP